ncbi:MAG: hydroxymethylbilane synthase [Proteobacteria bacterium]|nr:hydroxymethylbilane synthase [Pseudomonadota bacterium]MBU4384698.1 hydroxymethylbilane synthase [Pseudomonadota bacterium]MBU4606645.1 hydroxymethylbilane synthase [Pseudomonadota bacterium]MCG2765599.1 hydroxymethylbilane synthase [Desulfarculaceae bacterium]
MSKLTIATRGSRLALAQAGWVAARLGELHPGLQVEMNIIKTTGDKILDVPLAQVGGKGLFVKEIEDALLAGQADLAVHSMKDVPSELPQGLELAVVSEREDPRDALVSPVAVEIKNLPTGAKVGTSSLRRQAQLLALRPDLEMVSLRGNVETRLRKMDELGLQAVILASAGLNRLGLNHVEATPIPAATMLPAVGQGALGLEIRSNDLRTRELIAPLNHPETAAAVAAERAFLTRLEGGCQVPIAGHATVEKGIVKFNGLVADLQGKRVVTGGGLAPPNKAADMGRQVAEEILEDGGREILAEVYGEAPK